MSEQRNISSSSFAVWIGTAATVLALLATVYIGIRENREKALEVRFVATLSLLNEGSVADGLEVRFRDAAVTNVSKFLFTVHNAGDIPILPDDVEQPLTLSFSGRVLEVRITETTPTGVSAAAEITNTSSVSIRHGLLNPGDSVAVEALTDGSTNWPAVTFRISGINGPRTVLPEQTATATRVTASPLSNGLQGIVLTFATLTMLVVLFISFVYVIDDVSDEAYTFNADRESKALADLTKTPMEKLQEVDAKKVPAVFAGLVWSRLGPYTAKLNGQDAALALTFDPTQETLEQFVERGKQHVLTTLSQKKPAMWNPGVRKLLFLVLGTAAVIDIIIGAWRTWG